MFVPRRGGRVRGNGCVLKPPDGCSLMDRRGSPMLRNLLRRIASATALPTATQQQTVGGLHKKQR
ncbi:MAG: hypothetical protein DWG81_01025 [Chloroflexi bacterium]|nr:hypothetical protein [Chloroflexota bacterium]